ncbi:MAG: chemotaxis protein CheW [Ruminococcus sp.]|nr:chemotaxis protein CheW [Ruminococcus sp.]
METNTEQIRTHRYLTFLSADRKFAVPFHNILTVLIAGELHPIPEFPDYFAGTCVWEERAVPVIDARKRFGFGEGEYGNRSCILICETEFTARSGLGVIGILTDTVSEMEMMPEDKILPCEAVSAEAYTRYLSGYFLLGEKPCYIVDAGLMVNDCDIDTVKEKTQE